MRLYTLTGATAVDDPTYGKFTANPDGSFDFPNGLSEQLHSFAVNGKKMWESDAERELRVVGEELDRMRDPATLLAAIKEMGSNNANVMAALAAALGVAAAAPPAPVLAAEAPVEKVADVEPSAAEDADADGPGESTAGEAIAAPKATRRPRKTAASTPAE
jgi:hypothetical protein